MEFREIEMKTKLSEYLETRVRNYQHQGVYLEDDRV